jgi:fibronectin-binding autotransporter adhesin
MAVAAALGRSFSAEAAIYDWTANLTGPFNWDNAGGQNNWSIAGFPNAALDVANLTNDLFESQFIDLNQTVTIGVLNIGDLDGLNTFTIQAGVAGSLNFNNGPAAAEINQVLSSAGDTIFANVSTSGGLNLSNASANSLVFNGALSSSATSGTQVIGSVSGNVRLAGDISDGVSGGTISIVQNGFGTLSLLGNNSFTGGVTLNTGSLNIGNATALGAATSTLLITGGTITNSGGFPIALINNNPLVWAGDFTFNGADLDMGAGSVTMTGDRQIGVDAGNLIIGGIVSDGAGIFGITKTGAGTLTLSGTNAFDGPIVVNGGRFAIRNAAALSSDPQITVNPGGSFMLEGGITVNNKTLNIAGEGPNLGGALRSEGENVWGGDINANTSGIVRVVSAFGTLTLNGNIFTTGVHMNGLVLHGEGVINGVISGEGSLTRSNNDAGTWTLNAVNTYTGTTLISNGAIRLGNANAIQNSAVTVNSAAFDGLQFAGGIGNFNLVSLAGAAAANFTLNDVLGQPVNLTVGSLGTNTTYAGTINGTGSLIKVGGGTLALSNASTFSGGLNVTSGAISATDSLAHAGAVESVRNGLGTGVVTLADGTTLQLRANGNPDASAQVLVFGNAVTLGGAVTISVDRQAGTGGTNKILALGNLSIGEPILTVTSANGFALQFAAAALSGNATINSATANGNVIIGNVTETGGARSLTKIGPGRMTLSGTAGHTGGTLVNEGTLEVSGTHAGSATVSGGTLLVTGTFSGGITLSTGNVQIGNGGYSGEATGAITNDGTVTFNRADTFTYPGQLGGIGGLSKAGSGTLVLTGANTYGGTTTISNGTLMLDYSSNATVLNPATPVVLGGTLYIKGNSVGTTVQELGNLTTTLSIPGKIIIDNNGGGGTTLTFGNSWTFGGSNTLHIDLSRGGTLMSSPAVTNGVITAAANGVARAVVTGTDGRTYFANVSGGVVVPQTTLTPLAPNSNSGSTNFQVSGDLVTTTAITTGTLRIDTTTTAGSLDISGGNLDFARTAFLMDGSHDFEIKRTSGTGTIMNTVIHQHGTGALLYSAPIRTGGAFTKGGAGLLIGNMDSGAPGSITVNEGVYRVAKETAKPTGSTTLSGGVLELGSGDFTGGLGTGALQVRIIADGGFSAFGATRTVNLGGAGATVTWSGSNDFLPNNSTLYLSSVHSNATLDFVNPLNLGAVTRTVRVFDGSAPVDAQLSGALSGSGELRKTGPGALALNGTSSFIGITAVHEGTLLVNGRLAGSARVAAGTLQGNGDGFTTGIINGSVTVGNGAGSNDSILSPGNGVGTLTANGALSLASDARFRFELNSQLVSPDQMADLMNAFGISIAPSATFEGIDLALTSTALALNTAFVALNNTSFDPINGTFANLANGEILAIGANFFQANYFGGDGNDLALIVVVPEPASAVTLLGGCVALLGLRRPRRSRPGVVSALTM